MFESFAVGEICGKLTRAEDRGVRSEVMLGKKLTSKVEMIQVLFY